MTLQYPLIFLYLIKLTLLIQPEAHLIIRNISNLVYLYMHAVYRNDSVQEIQLFSKENQSGLCSTIQIPLTWNVGLQDLLCVYN
jgi:hypothetical protein